MSGFISLNISGFIPQIDVEKFAKAAMRKNKKVVKKAAQQFFIVASEKIPVWSGEAKGSLLRGAVLCGAQIVVGNPVATKKAFGQTVIINNIAKGRAQGEARFIKSKNKVRFHFRSNVRHLNILDKYPSNKPLKHHTPWEAFQAGRLAAKKYLEANAKLPEITKHITSVRHFK